MATAIRPSPPYTIRIGWRRSSRRGHSAISTIAGPSTRIKPTKPTNCMTETPVATILFVSPPLTGFGAPPGDGAPTEYVKPPPTGWLSAEITR